MATIPVQDPAARPRQGPMFFAAGFRPFFLFAALQAVLMLPLWLAAYTGNADFGLRYPPVLWHGHEMVFGFAGAALGGFLLTAVPNWTGCRPVAGPSLMLLFAVWLAGRVVFTLGGVVPAPVVREVANLLESTIPAGIHLEVRAEDLPAIRVSAGELHQVIMNLVINARDAVGEYGSIDIRLYPGSAAGESCAICRRPLSGEFVILEVSDSGYGIATECLPKIFDPFFTTKEVGKGTGLGLSVVQGIVQKAGGHALVTSVMGKGTTFRLLFPAVAAPEVSVVSAQRQPVVVAPAGKRLWVVDDEPVLLVYLKEILAGEGYDVRCFQDPTEVIRAFRKDASAVDLVLTDQTMPLVGGADLARTLLMRRPELPVILCTGHSDHVDEREARRIGIRHYFRKPVDPEVLLAAVARELEDTRSAV